MEDEIAEFISISQADRRTARFFLERQHNNVNNALEDYFTHPDITIPRDDDQESSNGSDNENNRRSSTESSSDSDDDHTTSDRPDDDNNRDEPSDHPPHDSNGSDKEVPSQQTNNVNIPVQSSFPTIEVDSSAIISSQAANIIEKEENYFSNDVSPFPKRKSKGKSAKVFIYSNGILLFEKFYDKSNSNEYAQILKSLQCGDLPSDLVSKHFIDIEICDLRAQEYSK